MADPNTGPTPTPSPSNQPEYGDKPWQNPDYGNKNDKPDEAEGCGCDSPSKDNK